MSTTSGARRTPVASWRPPSPASTTATSTPRRASSSNAAAVSTSNWVTRSPSCEPAVDLRGRLGRALHGGAEGVGPQVGIADPDPLGEAGEMRREVRAGAHAVRLEQRGRHPHGRALAVRADHVDRAEALLRRAERREQPAHALQPEAHPEQLEAEQVLLGARGAPRHSASRSSRRRASLSRSRGHDRLGRLGDEAVVAELAAPRARSRRRASRAAPRSGARPPRGRPRRTPARRRRRPGPPPSPPARRRRPTTRSAPAARRARPCARSRRPRAARAARPRARRRSRRASRAAPARRRSRARPRPRRRRRSATRRRPATACPSAARRRPGRATRSPRSRTGSPDGRSRASRRARAARSGRRPRSSSSYRRGLTISRYQSHSSP